MSFIARWLNLAKDRQAIGLRPHRDCDLGLGYDAAFDCVVRGIDEVLGAYVSASDRAGGAIEAAFGLVNNERVRCTLHSLDDGRTRVRIEAFFPAGATVREDSLAVDALANYLESASKPV